MSARSFLERFLTTSRVSVRGIRWAFIMVLFFLLMNVYVLVSFFSSPMGITTADWVYLAIIAIVTGPILIAFAWLGFSHDGMELVGSVSSKGGEHKLYRLAKIIVGAIGIAAIPWIAIVMVIFVNGNTDFLSLMFEPWVLLGLALLCFPISYKYIK